MQPCAVMQPGAVQMGKQVMTESCLQQERQPVPDVEASDDNVNGTVIKLEDHTVGQQEMF